MALPMLFDKFSALSLLIATSSASLALPACGGSMSANAQASSDAGAEVDFDAEGGWETTKDTLTSEQTNRGAEPSTPQGSASFAPAPLLGARHDLSLGDGSKETCKCLAAAVGAPDLPSFVWRDKAPQIDAQSQRIVALASDGIVCTESNAGASYMGYELKDGDVIVKIEAAVPGRPVTRGAIVPRPASGKQIYLEPVGAIPYGKGLSGEARCALGR